jgi:hypothetical protein
MRRPSAGRSTPPNCAGILSATIRSSSRSSGSDILKGVGGAASITTPRTLCVAAYGFPISERGDGPPPSGPRSATLFSELAVPYGCRPRVSVARPRRHIPNSIANMHRRLIGALVKSLPRCPSCNAPIAGRARRENMRHIKTSLVYFHAAAIKN